MYNRLPHILTCSIAMLPSILLLLEAAAWQSQFLLWLFKLWVILMLWEVLPGPGWPAEPVGHTGPVQPGLPVPAKDMVLTLHIVGHDEQNLKLKLEEKNNLAPTFLHVTGHPMLVVVSPHLTPYLRCVRGCPQLLGDCCLRGQCLVSRILLRHLSWKLILV